MNEVLSLISGMLWGWPMIVLLLGTHVFLTIRLRFPQRHLLRAIRLSVSKSPRGIDVVSLTLGNSVFPSADRLT